MVQFNNLIEMMWENANIFDSKLKLLTVPFAMPSLVDLRAVGRVWGANVPRGGSSTLSLIAVRSLNCCVQNHNL